MEQELYLRSDRLIIRTYQMGDEDQVYDVINDPKIAKMMLRMPYPYPREQLAVWLHFTRKNSEYEKGYECGIFYKEQYIGNVGIVNVDLTYHQAEITYFIGTKYIGQGFATEAVKTMLRFGFETLGLERIQGRCMCHNIGSKKVLDKCGFQYEGIGRHEVLKEGTYQDVYHSSILHSEYLNRR